jgi:fused signal recognition particle receptor
MSKRLGDVLRGAANRIAYRALQEEDMADLLADLRLKFVECDIAFDMAEEIVQGITEGLKGQKVPRIGSGLERLVAETLKDTLLRSIAVKQVDLLDSISERSTQSETTVIIFVGVNGSGKTTTIAKLAHLLKRRNFSVVLACSDTFRAGAIEQLQVHADKLGIRMVRRPYGSDPASVAYDALNHATSHGLNVVLIDTAGRMQTKKNLMDELEKIKRVVPPQFTIFVGDALAGNDVMDQARVFNDSIGFDAAVVTKFDADVKGGAALSIIFETKRPVIYVGTGQQYQDLQPFSPSSYVDSLLGHLTA